MAANAVTLYGPDNRPIRPSDMFVVPKAAAKRSGTLRSWAPRPASGTEAREREEIAYRAMELAASDPHGSGVVDAVTALVVGSGLTPHAVVDADILEITREAARLLQSEQRAAYYAWCPHADVGRRTSFSGVQYEAFRSWAVYGEFLVLVHMVPEGPGPFSLALQVLHPMRLKTPADFWSRDDIRDGVELGPHGEPVAYWVKKSGGVNRPAMSDTSQNFHRIEARDGSRIKVLHGFISIDPEQVRGISPFATAMKYFRDLNDYLDAELVSNIVTAAFALFIETGAADPLTVAQRFSGLSGAYQTDQQGTQEERIQELTPGMIYYGQNGERPHPIAAQRPGVTFSPFVKEIKKAVAISLGIPYSVLFRDVDGVSYAGFRSALLEAWRTVRQRRQWFASALCQPVYTMLMEEAYLRGWITYDSFDELLSVLTRADWIGPPKGDIEPGKEVEAAAEAVNFKLKTRAASVQELGHGDWMNILDQLEEEENEMRARNLLTNDTTTTSVAI